MQLQPVGVGELEGWQGFIAQQGLKETQPSVPVVPGPATRQFWVMDAEDIPRGLLSEIEVNEDVVEIGVRFWDANPANMLIADRWMREVLTRYRVAMARCYSSNKGIKRVLQRAGFRLDMIQDGVEFYAVSRDTYLGRGRNHG